MNLLNKKTIIYILAISTSLFMTAQHNIPKSIESEALKALSFYPELSECNIEIQFKKNIKKSTMQARPTFKSFFKNRSNRNYVILISEAFKISDKEFATKDIPSNILIGWIGHELGHIMDYQNRTKLNLISFGFKYLFSERFIVEAERVADTYAVAQGMEKYILATKNFILNHSDITASYKDRIKKYYLSPEEIMILVEERSR
ncbi:hypothetical protein MWU78_15210 [Arenibacter sp. F26102]|uniref:hypothetical protein n=1 Tax=Arenibacter sp. F26102 TaxID=2926416 RepID=UPI001FF253F6|nr:hypothetical protein [Arenibacter sp. F26102]MCK0147005.1 hypothetical protein [Arenibacter sp. F26102]